MWEIGYVEVEDFRSTVFHSNSSCKARGIRTLEGITVSPLAHSHILNVPIWPVHWLALANWDVPNFILLSLGTFTLANCYGDP
jgi:hypothetical protein